jgi:hypothetical protein
VLGFAIFGLAGIYSVCFRMIFPARLTLLGVLCFLATFLNPYHYKLWLVVHEYATQTTALRNINELLPPDFKDPREWFVIALFAASLVQLYRRGFPVFTTLLFLLGVFFSLRMRRDLWFGTLTSLMVLLPRVETETARPRTWATALTLFLSLSVTLAIGWQHRLAGGSLHDVMHKDSPDKAVEYMRTSGLPAPGFNTFDWGGYLSWYLPEFLVSMDGRTNLHGDARMQAYMKSWLGDPGWDDFSDVKEAKWFLVPVSTDEKPIGITMRLQDHPETFQEIYRDNVAVIFKRK